MEAFIAERLSQEIVALTEANPKKLTEEYVFIFLRRVFSETVVEELLTIEEQNDLMEDVTRPIIGCGARSQAKLRMNADLRDRIVAELAPTTQGLPLLDRVLACETRIREYFIFESVGDALDDFAMQIQHDQVVRLLGNRVYKRNHPNVEALLIPNRDSK